MIVHRIWLGVSLASWDRCYPCSYLVLRGKLRVQCSFYFVIFGGRSPPPKAFHLMAVFDSDSPTMDDGLHPILKHCIFLAFFWDEMKGLLIGWAHMGVRVNESIIDLAEILTRSDLVFS